MGTFVTTERPEQVAGVAGCSLTTAHRRFEAGIAALRERLGVTCPK